MRRFYRHIACLLILLAALCAPAEASTLALPTALASVGAEAFRGLSGVDTVVMSDAVTEIGSMAFAESPALGWVTIPGMRTTISADAFSGCAGDLLIRTVPDSQAMGFAQTHDVDYQAETTYRALVIGQTYYNISRYSSAYLIAPPYDAAAMAACLERFEDTNFQIDARLSLTAPDILSAIAEVFADAQPQDVSLFYYSGHGAEGEGVNGALVGADWSGGSIDDSQLVTVSQLRAALDQVPGRKILIIDACFSGAHILGEDSGNDASMPEVAESAAGFTAEDFLNSFMEGFSTPNGSAGGRRARAAAGGSRYFIMTAVSDSEYSYEYGVGASSYGLFTRHLTMGCGYDGNSGKPCDLLADANDNGVITFQEAYAYATTHMREEEINGGYTDPEDQQHAQVSPVNCDWFGFLRQ